MQTREGSHLVIGLAGNKVDLEAHREVTTLEGAEYAKEKGFIFFETSAKNDTNIKDMFRAIATEVPYRKQPTPQRVVIVEPPDEDIKKPCACNLL